MLKLKWTIAFFFIMCISINSISFDRGFPITLNPSWAQDQGKQIRGTRDGVIVRCKMYLMGKTEEGVIISEELFRILPSTVILDTEGEKITLRELKVPCIAFVEYGMKTDNSTPTVIRLHLLSKYLKSTEKKRKIGREVKGKLSW